MERKKIIYEYVRYFLDKKNQKHNFKNDQK